MASDEDIARLLPEPPPPRPARREASIAEALRRFDGTVEPLPATAPPRSRWKGLGRPQLGALISAALIALIGAPAAWISLHDRSPGPNTPAPATNATETMIAADSAAPAASPSPSSPAALAQPSVAARRAAPPPTAPLPVSADKAVAAPAADEASAAPAPSAPAMKAAAPPLPQSPTSAGIIARPAPTAGFQPDNAAADIAVTASRRRTPIAPGRADGDARSSEDDLDGVIATFDQALARDPHNSSAWLDRGLARQRKGDLSGALHDLNRAIRLAPDAPAGYRARARLERQRGDTGRAAADERRAANLESGR